MNIEKNWWKYLLAVWMSVVIWAAFFYAPRAQDLGESTRILFFHVPCAWIATLAFMVSALFSILYLKRGNLRDDLRAYSAAHIGIMFTVLATVTGAIWANEIWGSPWNWDPRETSIFILLLIYAAYFALRSSIEEEEKQARLGAVYSIIAFVTVPFFVFIVPRIYESLHPDPLVNAQGKIKMDAQMQYVFWSSLAGFTVLFFWMFRLKTEMMAVTRSILIRKV